GLEETDMAPRIRSQAQLAALRTAQVPPALHDHSIMSKTTAAAMAGHSIRSFDRLLASGKARPLLGCARTAKDLWSARRRAGAKASQIPRPDKPAAVGAADLSVSRGLPLAEKERQWAI